MMTRLNRLQAALPVETYCGTMQMEAFRVQFQLCELCGFVKDVVVLSLVETSISLYFIL